jgi:hypothetical protein
MHIGVNSLKQFFIFDFIKKKVKKVYSSSIDLSICNIVILSIWKF